MDLSESIISIRGIGEKTAALFGRVGVSSVYDLLNYIPSSYEKYPEPVRVSDLKQGQKCAVLLTVTGVPTVLHISGMTVLNAAGADGTGSVQLSWYNMPYLKKAIIPGMCRVFYGPADIRRNSFVIRQPRIFKPEEYDGMKNSLIPIYPLTRGLTGNSISKAVRAVFDNADAIEDYLSDEQREELGFEDLRTSLYSMHFPENIEDTVKARERAVFDEFYFFIRSVRKLREQRDRETNEFPMIEVSETRRLIEGLPYRLTGAQTRTYDDIIRDLSGKTAMNRLVQGDVGSGKTVVALLAMVTAVKNGYQAALMAPTEVLAAQHMKKISKITSAYGICCVLLSGSLTEKEKKAARSRISSGEAQIIIGTHALITDLVSFQNLALVVTDEQHRFGVNQRKALSMKCGGKVPHVLVMSATPIPRTLAIIIYGDLDISVMDEVPAERLAVKNCVVGREYRPKAYSFIRNEVGRGHQAYIICPQVEDSDSSSNENVTDYGEMLKGIFGNSVRVGILHGRMKPKEKDGIMEQFAAGNIDVLVSTTVVEVGVDVPNATVMMIENAECFGLSQLHQLRGRIGRGKEQSYCIFVNSSEDGAIKKRLEIMNSTNDGFKIASEDLKLRGPGDIFGLRQSGEFSFRVGDIFTDADILKKASDFAAGDPDISGREKIYELYEKNGEKVQL